MHYKRCERLCEGVTYGSKDDLKNFAKVLHKHGSGCDSSSFCQQFDFNLTAGVLLVRICSNNDC